jgi:hypothetical protein
VTAAAQLIRPLVDPEPVRRLRRREVFLAFAGNLFYLFIYLNKIVFKFYLQTLKILHE